MYSFHGQDSISSESRIPQSGHLVSCKSGPLNSEKLILLSRSRRRSLFQRSSFADSGIREFSLKHTKSRATSVRCGEMPGKEKERERRGREELHESRKTERRNSRRPGKMRIVCTHEGNYPLLFPLPLLVLSLFSPTFREEKERQRKRKTKEKSGRGKRRRERGEREREGGGKDKIPNFRGRFAVKGS